jgi:hypothetical protein
MFVNYLHFVVSLLLYTLISCKFVDGYSILRHKKLDTDELVFARQQQQKIKYLRPASAVSSTSSLYLNGEFIIELAINTTNVRSTIENLIVGSGGTINFVYETLFKGASISNMSDTSILKVLDHISVIRGSRVSFVFIL